MNDHNHDFVTQIRDELDDSLVTIDQRIANRLAAGRRQAVGQRVRSSAFVPRRSAAVLGAALTAIMVLLLRIPDSALLDTTQPGTPWLETSLANGDLELIEDLEFYRWLDANGHAG